MNRPSKIKTTLVTMSVKGVLFQKRISKMLLYILALSLLFLVSCVPNHLTYRKPGIYAECPLSGRQRLASLDTLAESCVYTYFTIRYDLIDKQDITLSGVNLLLGGKSMNLGTVKYEDVEGITPDMPCKKWVEKNDFDKDNPFYRVTFNFYGNRGEDDELVLVHFYFDKDKNITNFHCDCFTKQKTGCLKFEKMTDKSVFEPPLNVNELKALFGADAHISKSYSLK